MAYQVKTLMTICLHEAPPSYADDLLEILSKKQKAAAKSRLRGDSREHGPITVEARTQPSIEKQGKDDAGKGKSKRKDDNEAGPATKATTTKALSQPPPESPERILHFSTGWCDSCLDEMRKPFSHVTAIHQYLGDLLDISAVGGKSVPSRHARRTLKRNWMNAIREAVWREKADCVAVNSHMQRNLTSTVRLAEQIVFTTMSWAKLEDSNW